ncbi:DUF397 domain-containing protein [Streptomyces albofaciens JCM 4342]|uniref:DUF397 domain-containing protein n=1 Tax=Streptomyces albofaciens TaxID=66866 RepID=UPI0012397558|nr:DUF397 domain-containing protein [Streptomyces albofaciens]KAA6221370.1 DUF397 domain-containing protein [Streptomyces albofaciens JCM 4342]
MKISPTRWVKSSHSNPDGGNCLEWSPTTGISTGVLPVRDSKNPQGPILTFPTPSFTEFITAVKADAFSR